MSLRGRRAACAALLAAAAVALMYSGDAIYLWIIFFIGLLLAAGALQAALTLRAFRFKVELPEGRLMSGESASVKIRARVDLIIPPAHLGIRFSTADGEERTVYASPLPGRDGETTLEFDCPFRGEYEIGAVEVEAVDLFGLVRLKMKKDKLDAAQSRLVVYPRTVPVSARMLDIREREGAEEGARVDAEEISSVAGLRAWRDGDSLRRVHWKLSARTGSLVIKEFDGSFDARNVVFLDANLAEHDPNAPRETSDDEDVPRGTKKRRSKDGRSAKGASSRSAARSADNVSRETIETDPRAREERLAALAASFCSLYCERSRRVQLYVCGERQESYSSADGGFAALHLACARARFGDRSVDAAKVLELGFASYGAPQGLVYITEALSPSAVDTLAAIGSSGSRALAVVCSPVEPAARRTLERHGVSLLSASEVLAEGGAAI